MGKLNSFTFISLDGYYKGINNDISWNNHGPEENEHAAQNANSNPNGSLVFGRVTYEMMQGFWTTPMAAEMMPEVANGMNKSRKIVFSNTLRDVTWNNTTLIKGQLIQEIKRLKKEDPYDMTILGSGSIVTQLAEHNLIDRYEILLNPIAIGEGTHLFDGLSGNLKLKLVDSRKFKSGVILLAYEPA